mgnify:CR=1 FL=1
MCDRRLCCFTTGSLSTPSTFEAVAGRGRRRVLVPAASVAATAAVTAAAVPLYAAAATANSTAEEARLWLQTSQRAAADRTARALAASVQIAAPARGPMFAVAQQLLGGIGGGGGGTVATPPTSDAATGTGNILWILAGGGTEAGGGLATPPSSSTVEVFLSLLLPAISWASNAFRMES